MNGNANNQAPMSIEDLEMQMNQGVAMEQAAPQQMANNGTGAVRPDVKYADPSQAGYLPLLDLFEPVVEQIKKQFNMTTDINDIWLHINHKMFADVPRENLGFISPYNVLEHLYTCIDNNLNPLKPEVGSYYAFDFKSNTHSIKTQILLEGYNKIYSTHPQSNGLEYQIYPDVEREFVESEWVTNPQTHKKEKRNKIVKKMIPSRVECRIYRKDMEHPTVGFAFPDDIGNTGAWTGHPSQMMCNRAFTRAVRMAYNLEGTSSEDVVEIKNQNNQNHHTYSAEQELSYEKTANGIISQLSTCTDVVKLNEQIGLYKNVMDNLPAEYKIKVLTAIQQIDLQIKKNAAEAQQTNRGSNQTAKKKGQQGVSQDNQNIPNNQNMNNQGFDFEQQQQLIS